MPIYEYRCATCNTKQSKLWRSLAAVAAHEKKLTCTKCGRANLARVVSRVRVVRGGGGGEGAMADGGHGDIDEALMREMENVDENDPRALGRLMRKMAAASGESLGDEFDEVVGRLEKGEDPEKIEQDMGDLLGADGAGMGMDDDGMAGMADMAGGSAISGDESKPAAAPSEPKADAETKRVGKRSFAAASHTSRKPKPTKIKARAKP
jgi:putative FmdB family regulatory protein